MSKWAKRSISIVLVFFTMVVGWGVIEASSAESRGQPIRLRLPADFDKALSVTNSRNGMVLGYLAKGGKLRAVQYSGAKYSQTFFFDFIEAKK